MFEFEKCKKKKIETFLFSTIVIPHIETGTLENICVF